MTLTRGPSDSRFTLASAEGKRKFTCTMDWVKGEDMKLEGAVRRAYSRRSFLLGAVSATTAGVLAACSQPSQPAATTAPAAQPTAAAAAPTKPAAAAAASPSAAAAASPA